MPTDPSIILAGNPPPDFTQNYMTLYQFAQQVNQQRQQQQSQNALKQIFANPQSYDPKTNTPTPNALRQIMQVNPDMGMKLQGDMLSSQVKRMQEKSAETNIGAKKFEFMTSVAGIATDAYNDAKASGKSEVDAIHAATLARNEAVKNNGGVLGEDDADGIIGSAFDPTKAKALASANKEWVSTKSEAEKEKHDRYMEANADKRINITVGNQGNPVGSDDEDSLNYAAQVYREKGILPTLGMGKAGATFRLKVIQRAAKQAKDEGSSAAGDIGQQAAIKGDTSSLGNITKIADSAEAYENTATKNFDLALRLAKKGGVPTDMGPWVNRFIQDGETALGDKNIPPYAAALLTGANEYAKVMSGSTGSQGSTVDSRREAAAMFAKGFDYDQIEPVIGVAKTDMDNKKASYKDQRAAIQDRIKGAGDTMSGSDKNAQATTKVSGSIETPKSKSDYDALPSGAHYRKPNDPENSYRVKP